MSLLDVEAIHTSYGLSKVLFGVSLSVDAGEVVALLGRNGVGKTTTIRSIIGLVPPRQGTISFDGTDITGWSAHEVARLGIGYVPEDRRVFPDLTVWENLDIARRPSTGANGWDEERVYELFPDLKEIRDRDGGVLSGGQQQMLTIARCLMGNPKLVLLDEPSEGLAPIVVETLQNKVAQLKEAGLAIVLAEQNLNFVLSLSDRLHILEKGEIKYSGTPEALRDNEEVLKTYLTV